MSYKGIVVPYVAGQGGFNANDNIDAIPQTDLLEAKNIRFDGNAWRKVGGLTAYDANAITGTPTCLAGIDWWPTTSVQRQVTVWSNGNLYKSISGDVDAVTLANSIANTSPMTFLACGSEYVGNARKLLLFSAGITPIVLSGDANTAAAISNPSADWSGSGPRGGIMHDGRVCAWMGHDIYFSNLNDHTDFATGAFPPPSFTIAGGEGEYISACWSIGTTRLYIFKYPGGIYYVDTQNITSFWLPVTTLRTDLGVAGPRAICRAGDAGTWFIGSDGNVYSLELISNPDVDPRSASITGMLQLTGWLNDNVNLSYIKNAQLIYDPARKEVTAYYTSTSGTSNDVGLVFDVTYPQQVRACVEDRGTYFNAAWLAKESSTKRIMYVAGTGGKVYKANQSTRQIGAAGYMSRLFIPHSDLSWFSPQLGQKNKRLDWLEMRVKGTGTTDIYCDIYIDGSYYATEVFTLDPTGSPLDDTDYGLTPNTTKSDFTLASDDYIRAKIKIGGFGRTVAFKLYNQTAGDDFSISSMRLHCAALGEGGEVST